MKHPKSPCDFGPSWNTTRALCYNGSLWNVRRAPCDKRTWNITRPIWRQTDFTKSTENNHICVSVSFLCWKIYRRDNANMCLTTWWRHQLEPFSALLALCAGNSPFIGEFIAQRPATRSFDVFFDLPLNERLSKQSWGWWFETSSRPLWSHSNDFTNSSCTC